MSLFSSKNYFDPEEPGAKIAREIMEAEAVKDSKRLTKKDALGGDDDVVEVNPDLTSDVAPTKQ